MTNLFIVVSASDDPSMLPPALMMLDLTEGASAACTLEANLFVNIEDGFDDGFSSSGRTSGLSMLTRVTPARLSSPDHTSDHR